MPLCKPHDNQKSRSSSEILNRKRSTSVLCLSELYPEVMMVQSAEDRQRQNAIERLDRPRCSALLCNAAEICWSAAGLG
jgi:hypothetical protein